MAGVWGGGQGFIANNTDVNGSVGLMVTNVLREFRIFAWEVKNFCLLILKTVCTDNRHDEQYMTWYE